MSNIAPNTDIQFFSDLGLSPDQENTFYFSSTALKDQYFDGLVLTAACIATVPTCSYVREHRNRVRVQIANETYPVQRLQGAAYMRYKNNGFGTKWFYAFVLEVEYINNITVEVTFQIDPIMTWMGTYTLGRCLVEREHTASDNIGEHLIDEGVSTGVYVLNYIDNLTPYRPVLVVSTTADYDPEDPSAIELVDVDAKAYYGNMLSGCTYKVFPIYSSSTAVEDAIAFIDRVVLDTKQDSLVSMRIVPDYCAPNENGMLIASDLTVASGGTASSTYTMTSLAGYVPKNNKMFSYPYITYEVINGEGGAAEYRPELFANPLIPSFMYRGVSFDVCEVMLAPQGYKRSGLSVVYDEALMMRDFPQASFPIDQYKAYIAQMTSGGGWLNVLGTVGTIAAGAAAAGGIGAAFATTEAAAAHALTSAATGAAISGAGEALKLMQDNIRYDALPSTVKGTANSNIMSAMGKKVFIGYHKSITAERAEAIDGYFTMYGYKVNQVKEVSCANRPHFTYVKTMGCNVHGALPASDARAIENAFNRGIRFWKTPTEIGDYSLDNAPDTQSEEVTP